MFLSVVIPFYNEQLAAERVINAHLKQLELLSSEIEGWELVLLDDASTDRTWAILNEASQKSGVRIIRHETNQGIVKAFARLFQEAKGSYIYLTAGDGQWPAENLMRLWQEYKQSKADLVIGVRQRRYLVYDPWRTLLSYGFNAVAFFMMGYNGRDINGIKLGRREIFVEPLKSQSFSAEIERLQRALGRGYKISKARVSFVPRIQGKARGAQLHNIWSTLKDLGKIK